MRSFVAGLLVLAVGAGVLVDEAFADWRWGIGVTGGYLSGGDLYRAVSDDTATPTNWPQPGGGSTVTGTEIRAEIDGFPSGGVRATFLHDRGFGFIVSADLSDLDVPVIRRTLSDNVDKVNWDQWFTTSLQAVATYSLIPDGNTPYVLGGVGMVQFESEGDALDATNFAFVIGAGFRMWATRMVMLDLEVRDAITSLSLDDEQARLADLADSFEPQDRVHLLGVTLSASLVF